MTPEQYEKLRELRWRPETAPIGDKVLNALALAGYAEARPLGERMAEWSATAAGHAWLREQRLQRSVA